MAKVLTDDSLTQEEAKIVARRAGAALKGAAKSMPKAASSAAQAGNDMLDPTLSSGSGMAGQAVEQAAAMARNVGVRSEEHTSELQSPYDLVCRLLLEKKKNKHKHTQN